MSLHIKQIPVLWYATEHMDWRAAYGMSDGYHKIIVTIFSKKGTATLAHWESIYVKRNQTASVGNHI